MKGQQLINRKRTNKIYAFAHGAYSAIAAFRRTLPRNQSSIAAFIG
jgi:hypothetical protein